jgi:hypothetical protein
LRTIFQRLNKNVVSLNKQELRQATYWGPFLKAMNLVSDKEYWGKIDVFTPNDIRRMLDVEYISELAIFALHGFQNKKDNLDKYYEMYEEEFDREKELIETFDTVNSELLKSFLKYQIQDGVRKQTIILYSDYFQKTKQIYL